ncbi:leukocyte immunoglobulin-like receptor subfamily B member 2 isoform X2 [Erinaceus europaeus]|uniref:Leukocyte immunoglobulin-like receptor subfamily B member 2 isoform X2 n=1 Tax=Erinaceus europaeus TaxID=9365 RepID=A0ABM3W4Z5_ERIEU|nr:leukocyte immunoglobulin-like receptor subfamily B member 2 isoform X2 [Erinaceus europaeus]
MAGVLPTLLCLGWCLGWSVWAQMGRFVLNMTPVTIQCRAPLGAEATAFRIYRDGSSEPRDTEQGPQPEDTGSLQITVMTADRAGQYHCQYGQHGHWSLPSVPLNLVMTGAYGQPTLSRTAGSEEAAVTAGAAVRLQCVSTIRFDVLVLSKEEDSTITFQNAGPQGKVCQSVFSLDNITSTQAGTYRCYGHFHTDPLLWSSPSDPLQLEVRALATDGPEHSESRPPTEAPGKAVPRDPRPPLETPKGPKPTTPELTSAVPEGSGFLKKYREVLIGVPVATVVLLLLLFLLLYCCKARSKASPEGRQPAGARATGGQVSQAKDPEEVTYSQVTCRAPAQGTGASRPTPTQTSEYVTLALK